MSLYARFGFKDFVLPLGYKGEVIKQYFHDYNIRNTDFTVDLKSGNITTYPNHIEDWRVTLCDTGQETLKGGRLKRVAKYIDTDRFMGFIMVSAGATLLLGRFDPRSLALALPVGLMVAGVLYYQSLPEIETDLAAGKHTLANTLGKDGAALVFRLWWPAVWVLLGNLWATGLADWPVALGLLALPFYVAACRHINAAGHGDWLPLDAHGHLVRKCYLISGAALILGVAL